MNISSNSFLHTTLNPFFKKASNINILRTSPIIDPSWFTECGKYTFLLQVHALNIDVKNNQEGKTTKFVKLVDALMMNQKLKFNLDLKQTGMAKKVVDIINSLNANERVLVSSFSPKRLDEFLNESKGDILTSGTFRENAIARFLPLKKRNFKVQAIQAPFRWKGIQVHSKKLVEFCGPGFEKAFLLSAGTETTEAALKLMRMSGQLKNKRRSLRKSYNENSSKKEINKNKYIFTKGYKNYFDKEKEKKDKDKD